MKDLDGALTILLFIFLILVNVYTIKWYRNGRLHLWGSGLLLATAGVILGFLTGAILVPLSGAGGALYGAFVGLVIVGNGLLLFLTGLTLTIGKRLSKKNTQA
ncbi:inner-membrane translocator [Halobacillus litoralis]|uniref:Inner-membrane translocator n=1 Tax=Halobacillus litoralis TaxID=45668 RepID=A0A845EF67_9BACI|nr:inner-membrane translocator [Halobacillus litoralis]MYL49868.1 inner-membrane translocator [Halobacillus litoralis]